MLDYLSIRSSRFEFETEQFVVAIRNNINIHQIDIETIYIENNYGINSNLLKDSFRIYFILLRYVSVSIITFFIEITVFVFLFNIVANIFCFLQEKSQSVVGIGAIIGKRLAKILSGSNHCTVI